MGMRGWAGARAAAVQAKRRLDKQRDLPYAVGKMPKDETLGQFEQLILAAITLLGDNAYGATVHEKIEELANGKSFSIGAVYTTMDRLQEKGYVRSWYGGAGEQRGQRSKRYFEIQAAGSRALQRSLQVAANLTARLQTAANQPRLAYSACALLPVFFALTGAATAEGPYMPTTASGPTPSGLMGIIALAGLGAVIALLILKASPRMTLAIRYKTSGWAITVLDRTAQRLERRAAYLRERQTSPPRTAEYLLLLLLRAQDAEAMAGDLEERYPTIASKFGHRQARLWYWSQTIRSLWPLMRAAIARVSKVAAIIEIVRRVTS